MVPVRRARIAGNTENANIAAQRRVRGSRRVSNRAGVLLLEKCTVNWHVQFDPLDPAAGDTVRKKHCGVGGAVADHSTVVSGHCDMGQYSVMNKDCVMNEHSVTNKQLCHQ
jgi:hypothetical protein